MMKVRVRYLQTRAGRDETLIYLTQQYFTIGEQPEVIGIVTMVHDHAIERRGVTSSDIQSGTPDPRVNGEVLQLQVGGITDQYAAPIHPGKAKGLSYFAGNKANGALQRPVVTGLYVIGIPVSWPPTHQPGRRWSARWGHRRARGCRC